MPRPTSITDEQILDAARTLFLERGISATTAEVAKRARIAEGSIFNRFKTKQALFKAAMRPHLEDPDWLKLLEERAGKGDPREALGEVALVALAFFRRILPLMMMSWSNPDPKRLMAQMGNHPALRGLKRLTRFFEGEIRAGRLRRHDPEILARAFIGSIQNYVFLEIILKANDDLPLPEQTYVRGLVNLFWVGIEPRKTAATERKR